MNIYKMNQYMKQLYNVADVKTGYDYWYFKLINLILGLFEYQNVPAGLSGREIEVNLIMTGHAVILAKNNGELFTPLTSIFNYDEYYQPTMAVFANPRVITTKQFEIVSSYYYDNLTLSEIGDNYNISRQAVNDCINQSVKALESYEEKLQLLSKQDAIIDKLTKVANDSNNAELSSRLAEIIEDIRG